MTDRVVQAEQQKEAYRDDETIQLLLNVLSEIKTLQDKSRKGEQAALYSYVEDLELDPDVGFESLPVITQRSVLATLQQAMGREMKETRGIDTVGRLFENGLLMRLHVCTPPRLVHRNEYGETKSYISGRPSTIPHLLEPNVTPEIQKEIQAGSIEEEFETAVKESF